MNPIRVLIVDDQEIFRDGLKALLDTFSDIIVVGVASNGEEAYKRTKELNPNLILMDISMPEINGVEATRLIKIDFPSTVIIMLTTFDDDEYIIKAMIYGASGYILKDINTNKLVEAIRNGFEGNIIFPGRIAAKLVSRIETSIDLNVYHNDFTLREMDVISLLLKGRNNQEIANELFLSVGTVKNYITQIYIKLDVKDRANAVIKLKKMGF